MVKREMDKVVKTPCFPFPFQRYNPLPLPLARFSVIDNYALT